MNTELLVLAALSIGLTVADLEKITVGMLCDLLAEKSGDYERDADQSDFDAFWR